MLLVLIYLSVLFNGISGARILCVFPMPSVSHQFVFKAYTQALAKNGHELVILTTNSSLPINRPKDNITEIDIGASAYIEINKILGKTRSKGLTTRGIVNDMEAYTDVAVVDLFSTVCSQQFQLQQVKQLIEDKNQHFDLIIMESIIEFPLILSKIFKAPVIYFSSFYGTSENYDTMGSVSRHPFLYPQSHRTIFDGESFWDKVKEVYWDWKFTDFYRQVKENSNRLLKAKYGPDTPTIDDLRQNVHLMFINVNHMLDSNRPVPPNVVYLGALHLQPVKELPKDLKSILDKSKNGVVYFSFGTLIRATAMTADFMNELLKAFAALPYDVLWKFEIENLENKPENVIIKKWLPQRDLLMHPKIKAFVTQGGLQSMDEAIDAGVPIVGIPLVADQWYNMRMCSKMGIGIKLDGTTLTAQDLVEAITKIIDDNSYKDNIAKIRRLMRDQPQTPMERAIWWTEYVIRHGGANHLRSPSANLPWSEFLMFDILVPVSIALLVIVSLFILLVLYITRCFIRLSKVKVKEH